MVGWIWVVEMNSPARGPQLGPNVHTTDMKKEEFERMGKKKDKRNLWGWVSEI
jgi:hypothetical protein